MRTILTICFFTIVSTLRAQAPTYWQDVRPVLRKYCIACHTSRNLKEIDLSGGLALDNHDVFMKNAKKPVVVPGKSGESELIRRILSKDENTRMPPSDTRVPDEALVLLKRWIDSGAAEGRKPETTETIVTTTPTKRRKLTVSLPTTALPAQGIFDAGKPDRFVLTLRIGPLSPVTAVVFSPDGKLLATGSYGRVCVWDMTTGRPTKVLTNVLGSVNDLRFSPDGKLLAVAGGQPSAQGDLRLFEVEGWKLKTVLRGHEDVVASLAFRPDGKKLASASFDRTLRIWDMASLKPEAILEPHSDFILAVAWSADGKHLASASKDRSVKLIDAETRKSLLTFSGMTMDVQAVAFNGDGSRVVSSGQEFSMFWWNAKTAERDKLVGGHRGPVHELAFSRDGKTIVSAGGDGNVIVWDGITGVLQKTLPVGSLTYAVALSADSRLIAAGSAEGTVRLFESKTGRHLLTLLEAADDRGASDWLSLTPEGYTSTASGLSKSGEWRMAGRLVPAALVLKTLAKDDLIANAIKGTPLPAPAFVK